jgi:hypothetical protein
LQVLDLALLLRERRLLQREVRGALALERRVVAGVGLELVAVDVNDRLRDRVEEVAVVRDQEQRARVALEPVLEPQHRVEVEVVGRLVEQQQVGARRERLREVEAHAPAAREARDRVGVARVGDAQARQELGRPRARGVAADLLVPVVQLGERVAVRGVLALLAGERGFDLAQLDVAVEHEVEGRRARPRASPARRARSSSAAAGRPCRILVDLAAQQREQARLAAAVGPDDADAMPRVHGHRRAFEQAVRAAREREVVEPDHSA